ncbi:MAG: hypothetical protein AMXMBFR84_39590 [Candidatus Hydrogenedentota bacterium]
MRVLDFSFAEPDRNLALDEVLLDAVEAGDSDDVLRFWESPVPFVVLGVSQVLHDHVWADVCRAEGVRVQRRCSAGGCVLQGPGSLNFALALRYSSDPAYPSLRGSYCRILELVGKALATAGCSVTPQGVSDLAEGERKVSGNAQKRRKYAFLHHGTLLYRVNAAGMTRYLKEPEDRPAYRGGRTHESFLTALPLQPEVIKSALAARFCPGAVTGTRLEDTLLEATNLLVDEKYSRQDWIHRR